MLIITKGIGKRTETGEKSDKKTSNKYKAKQAHVELAERMRQRDQGVGPAVGDRVAYVFVHSEKGTKGYDKSEDPIIALENDIPIDIQYYIEHQLKKPLKRIFKHIIPEATEKLFSKLRFFNRLGGEHTKNRHVAKVGKLGMGKFLQAKLNCLGCKTGIESGDVCPNCMAKRRQIYIERMIELSNYEKTFADLWVQCQRCQNSLHESLICHK